MPDTVTTDEQRETLAKQQAEIASLHQMVEDLQDELRISEKRHQMFEHLLEQEKEKAEAAQRRADELLHNILPSSVAAELKEHNRVKPRRYDSVSIMFMDIKGFTGYAEKMEPEALVEELDFCFQKFDEITERLRLEKIKTIGDAYMCAAGIPEPYPLHSIHAALAGLEIQAFMRKVSDDRVAKGKNSWQLRLGIHTGGPLVAGVIGKRKFAYDIWGDSVVTASRIESKGEVFKVNVSESTHVLVDPFFECEYRGRIEVKNKVEPMGMYFVHRIKPEYSADEAGLVPNDAFWAAVKAAFPSA